MLRVISANRLTDGAVVYVGPDAKWVERFDAARAFEDAAALDAALARAQSDERANIVLDIAVVDARRSGDELQPAHIREAIRAAGPTVHPDHGKQAADAKQSDGRRSA